MKYLVLKPLHADLGGHLPGAEIPVGPGMGLSLIHISEPTRPY